VSKALEEWLAPVRYVTRTLPVQGDVIGKQLVIECAKLLPDLAEIRVRASLFVEIVSIYFGRNAAFACLSQTVDFMDDELNLDQNPFRSFGGWFAAKHLGATREEGNPCL
jgi:hypothetical protein